MRKGAGYLVLLEDPPFFTTLELRSFTMLTPVDGIAHGRHSRRLFYYSNTGTGVV